MNMTPDLSTLTEVVLDRAPGLIHFPARSNVLDFATTSKGD